MLPEGLWRNKTDNGAAAHSPIPLTFAELGGQAAFNDARVQVAKR